MGYFTALTDPDPIDVPRSFWIYNQPNGYNWTTTTLNNCSVFITDSGTGPAGWSVENCAARHPFVCQKIQTQGK